MNRSGRWSLAPAYDVAYNYNPQGRWTSMHQMSIQGKVDGFTIADLDACAKVVGLKPSRVEPILRQVSNAVAGWKEIASEAGVDGAWSEEIGGRHRVLF